MGRLVGDGRAGGRQLPRAADAIVFIVACVTPVVEHRLPCIPQPAGTCASRELVAASKTDVRVADCTRDCYHGCAHQPQVRARSRT